MACSFIQLWIISPSSGANYNSECDIRNSHRTHNISTKVSLGKICGLVGKGHPCEYVEASANSVLVAA